MNTIIVAIIFAFGFIGMPLAFLYMLVIVPYKKYKRCSEQVEGKIIDTYKNRYVYKDSDNDTRVRISYIATCEYYFRGEKYTGEVESKGRKFNASVGEMLSFYINPDNPFETYFRRKSQWGQTIIVTVCLMMFIVAGGSAIFDILTSESVSSDTQQEQVYNEDATIGNGTAGSEMASGDGQGNNDQDVSAQKDNENLDNKVTGSGDTVSQNVDATTVILENKNVKNDMNPKFIKNAQKITMDGVALLVPKTFKSFKDTVLEKQFYDTVSGDNFIIKVGDTTKEIYEHHKELREVITQNYIIDKFDTYSYNGNNFLVACTKEGSGILFVIAVNEKKNVYIEYKIGKFSTLDLRDILSTVIF